jgi:Zn-dependent peptidase ImmA (M78 family)
MENVQLSLFEQAQRAYPHSTDLEVVRSLCDQLLIVADQLPPVRVEVIASLRGVVRIEERIQPHAGMILSDGSGLLIRVRALDSRPRRRFTILHEAAHTLLPGFADTPQLCCDPPGGRSRTEMLCDIAASELLLPGRSFIPDLRNVGFGMGPVELLADAYEASIEATALRTIDLWAEPAMLLAFAFGHKPSEKGKEAICEPKLRVVYSHRQGAWPFVLRHKSVEQHSAFARAYAGESVEELGSLDEIATESGIQVQISARRYGQARVLAIVRSARHDSTLKAKGG